MQKTTGMTYRRARLGRIAAAAILALGVLALPPSLAKGQAADLAPSGTNASLVFSPSFVAPDSPAVAIGFNLCAWNKSNLTVEATFIGENLDNHSYVLNFPGSIGPGQKQCAGIGDFFYGQSFWLGTSLVLNSPTQCSQATEYPGKCRVVASLERFSYDANTGGGPITNFIHMEPVLLPGLPGSPRLTNLPQ